MKNTKSVSPALPRDTVAKIKGMGLRRDKQMHIAIWFGLNQARVNEIINGTGGGTRYKAIPAAPPEELPPPGPYTVMPSAQADAYREVIRELHLLIETYETKLAGNVAHGI